MTTQPRDVPFPDEAIRFVDGLLDDYSIPFATAATLKLYGDASAILGVRERWYERGRRYRLGMTLALGSMAVDIMRGLPPMRAAALVATSYPHLARDTVNLAECLASWAFEDERKGGALKPHLRMRRYHPVTELPTKRVARRLHAPSWIRQFVKNDDSACQRRAMIRQFFAMPGHGTSHDVDPADLMWLTDDLERVAKLDARSTNQEKPITDAERKVIRRSAAFAASVIGEQAVSSLLRGDHHDVVGIEFTFRVRLRYGARGQGHGQLDLGLMSLEGEHLADLCLYFPGTPALDQVAALAMHVAVGDGADVLKTANVIRSTARGDQHPLITGRARQPETAFNREHRLQREYFRTTRTMWVGSIMTFVFGARRAGPLCRFFASTP